MNKTPDLFAALRAEILQSSAGELPAIVGQLATLHAETFALICAGSAPKVADDEDRLLSVNEVAERLGETSSWVRTHKKDLPRVKMPGRLLRFSEKRLQAMIKRRSYG